MMVEDIELKIKKRNKILFSRESVCLQPLKKLIGQQKHTTLVLWAFECMEHTLKELERVEPQQNIPCRTLEICDLWARGEVKMPLAKQAILDCHALAKTTQNHEAIALYHAIGQGCSTVHVETHALGLVFYELTALVIKKQYKAYEETVLEKIGFYEERLKWWEAHIEEIEPKRSWAGFLIKPGKVNKEALLEGYNKKPS